MNYSHDIFYRDSLLSVHREKEFINKGKAYVQDGYDCKLQRKKVFLMPTRPNTDQSGKRIVDSVKREVANYYSGEEFLALERKAPKDIYSEKCGTTDNFKTHYWGELSIKGAERRGGSKGIQLARDSVKNQNHQSSSFGMCVN